MQFLNRCIWGASAAGVGSFVVAGAAQNGYVPANCEIPLVRDGGTYHYFAQSDDGSQHEEGDGVYTVATSTLTRAVIRNSSNGGAIVNFAAPPTVYMGGPVANDIKTVLTANATYHVSPSGSDITGDGSAGKPWQTLQHASDFITQTLDLAGYFVVVQCANNPTPGYADVFMGGFYSSASARNGVSAYVQFVGDNVTPANVWAGRFYLKGVSYVPIYVGGFHHIQGPAFRSTFSALPDGTPTIFPVVGQIILGDPNMDSNIEIECAPNWYTCEGNIGMSNANITWDCTSQATSSPFGFYFATQNSFAAMQGNQITILGNPNVTFVRQDVSSYSQWFISFIGACQGERFEIQAGGELFGNGGTEFFPGNTSGRINSGGRYVDGSASTEAACITGISAIADQNINYQQPTTGFNITLVNTSGHLILDPAGALATGTVTMPSNPVNGHIADLRTSQTITAFTIAPGSGQTVVGWTAGSTLAAGQAVTLVYRLANTTWYAGT